MGRTYVVSVTEVEKKQDVMSEVAEFLRANPDKAYAIVGIMTHNFGVKEKEIDNKPFSEWAKGQPTLYSGIRRSLDKLIAQKKVKQKKYGRAIVYWWAK